MGRGFIWKKTILLALGLDRWVLSEGLLGDPRPKTHWVIPSLDKTGILPISTPFNPFGYGARIDPKGGYVVSAIHASRLICFNNLCRGDLVVFAIACDILCTNAGIIQRHPGGGSGGK